MIDRRSFVCSTIALFAGIARPVMDLFTPKQRVITCEMHHEGVSSYLSIRSDADTLREIYERGYRKCWAVAGHDYDALWKTIPESVPERNRVLGSEDHLLISCLKIHGVRYKGRRFHEFFFEVVNEMARDGASVKHLGDDITEEVPQMSLRIKAERMDAMPELPPGDLIMAESTGIGIGWTLSGVNVEECGGKCYPL